MDKIEDTVIYWPSVRIIVHKDEDSFEEVLVPLDKLKWNGEDEEQFLTLAEISDQLQRIGYGSPYYVWYELGLFGAIYLYGNYYPKEWAKHGTTKGYA